MYVKTDLGIGDPGVAEPVVVEQVIQNGIVFHGIDNGSLPLHQSQLFGHGLVKLNMTE